jgi:signal transduction histidine kinase
VANDVRDLMKVRADTKGLPLKFEQLNAMPKQVETDPTRLRQILINLVGNAIKFTEKGHIALTVQFVPDGETGPELQFSTTDTGIGMTTEMISKLFQPFTQADNSTTRKFGGTGLGLTISRRLSGSD